MSYIKTNKSIKFETSTVLERAIALPRKLVKPCGNSVYEDEKKQIRKWEGLHRKNDAEAVIIIAKMEPSDRYIIIRQFRPPTNSYLLEFPAGLVDRGETREQTAIRELFRRNRLCWRGSED